MGRGVYNRLTAFEPPGDPIGGAAASPDYETGWYGYVQKDLRDLFGPKPRGRFSRVYCGGGRRGLCRARLRGSLFEALKVTKHDLYGHDSTCRSEHRVEASCFDETRSVVASGVDVPSFPWINRPTFQQVVEPMRQLPR